MRSKRELSRMMALSRVSPWYAVTFLPTNLIPADSTVVFMKQSYKDFSLLQSRVHEVWARFMSSSMKDDLRYAPTDCYETFPFPPVGDAAAVLEKSGQDYYDFRALLMVRNNEGLTKIYNRFNRRQEQTEDIHELRRRHDAVDRAVLDAYGWHDIQPLCDFFTEFEDEEEEDDAAPGRARAKKYRYRWPDDIHDEVLARLLSLNRERAAAQNPAKPAPRKMAKASDTKKSKLQSQNPGLF